MLGAMELKSMQHLEGESFSQTYQGVLRCCCFDTREVGGVILGICYKS